MVFSLHLLVGSRPLEVNFGWDMSIDKFVSFKGDIHTTGVSGTPMSTWEVKNDGIRVEGQEVSEQASKLRPCALPTD